MHHAELIVGDYPEGRTLIPEDERAPSPDLQIFEYDSFGIGEARLLGESAQLRPVERDTRIFIVAFDSITLEAQNALLKLFEEPPLTARFYVIAPREDMFIPTLLSRLHIRHSVGSGNTISEDAKTFIEAPISERLALIASKLKDKDTLWADDILRGIELTGEKRKDIELLREVTIVRKHFYTRGASKKMLLEHLALTI